MAPDGAKVFVTGGSYDSDYSSEYATVAYSTETGAQVWVARYNPRIGYRATSLAVAPDGSKVFVTGGGAGSLYQYGSDYATVAYRANSCANGKDETGPVSGQVHQVEPLAAPAAAPYVHGVTCDAVAGNGL